MIAAIQRTWAVFLARNLEFLRDRSSLGWNLILPIALVLGLAFVFSGPGRPLFKVGVAAEASKITEQEHAFFATRFIDFYAVPDKQAAIGKVGGHTLDMLVEPVDGQLAYWVNPDSPKGYVLERLLIASQQNALPNEGVSPLGGHRIRSEGVRYVDWLLPGILGMNMMFSCLFGVGYVIVRYRKSGYLKRLSATPLRAIEFVAAQILSRWVLIMLITIMIYAGTQWLIGFRMTGSHALLFLIASLGAFAMIAMGFIVAARVTSEELAGGLLNMATWPMMFLSGVWFSLEGAPNVLQSAAQLLPLTHLLDASRAVMLDGAGWAAVAHHLLALTGMSILFAVAGAWMFSWSDDR